MLESLPPKIRYLNIKLHGVMYEKRGLNTEHHENLKMHKMSAHTCALLGFYAARIDSLFLLFGITCLSCLPGSSSPTRLVLTSPLHIYTGCPGRNVPNFGRMFLKLKYTDITQNTYIQSWTVTEIMAREFWKYGSCYALIDYQIHIKTGRNMWFL